MRRWSRFFVLTHCRPSSVFPSFSSKRTYLMRSLALDHAPPAGRNGKTARFSSIAFATEATGRPSIASPWGRAQLRFIAWSKSK